MTDYALCVMASEIDSGEKSGEGNKVYQFYAMSFDGGVVFTADSEDDYPTVVGGDGDGDSNPK